MNDNEKDAADLTLKRLKRVIGPKFEADLLSAFGGKVVVTGGSVMAVAVARLIKVRNPKARLRYGGG